jgi:transketolase
MTNAKLLELQGIAKELRIDIIRTLFLSGSGHPGGSLSAADILSVLFFDEMNVDPADVHMPNRDKFVMSKGHGAPGLYVTMAHKGYFPIEELKTLRKLGTRLQGHPDMKLLPGVEMSTGSLGQGFSASVGMAIAGKLDQSPGRVYTLMGDGEMQEGLVWEAFMSAAHFGLDNLTVIVDWNGLQIDGRNDDIMCIAPLAEKIRSFCWETIEIDGHDIEAIADALAQAKTVKGRPVAIIAKTLKGKGVTFMEDNHNWHGKAPNEEEARLALKELGGEWEW